MRNMAILGSDDLRGNFYDKLKSISLVRRNFREEKKTQNHWQRLTSLPSILCFFFVNKVIREVCKKRPF